MYIVQFLCAACFCMATFGLEQEPKCYSKFDWEEKLLEKTIKTELLMQQYLTTMNTAMESIQGLRDEFKDMKVNLDSAVGEYRAIIDQQNQRIEEYIKPSTTPTLAFNVRDATDLSPDQYEVMRFKTILLNVGDGYDETTGVFTSPVNGTFLFSIQVATNYQKWGRLQLVCDTSNNVILSIAHYNGDATYSSTSNTVAQVLNRGQRVWVQFEYNAGSTTVLNENPSYASNQFSGLLVHTV